MSSSDTFKFDRYLIDIMKKIGFKEIRVAENPIGFINEYKYHSPFLENMHYTMVIFRHKGDTIDGTTGLPLYKGIDYRLYVHDNDRESYVSSKFQTSINSELNRQYVKSILDTTFKTELREITIDEILKP